MKVKVKLEYIDLARAHSLVKRKIVQLRKLKCQTIDAKLDQYIIDEWGQIIADYEGTEKRLKKELNK